MHRERRRRIVDAPVRRSGAQIESVDDDIERRPAAQCLRTGEQAGHCRHGRAAEHEPNRVAAVARAVDGALQDGGKLAGVGQQVREFVDDDQCGLLRRQLTECGDRNVPRRQRELAAGHAEMRAERCAEAGQRLAALFLDCLEVEAARRGCQPPQQERLALSPPPAYERQPNTVPRCCREPRELIPLRLPVVQINGSLHESNTNCTLYYSAL